MSAKAVVACVPKSEISRPPTPAPVPCSRYLPCRRCPYCPVSPTQGSTVTSVTPDQETKAQGSRAGADGRIAGAEWGLACERWRFGRRLSGWGRRRPSNGGISISIFALLFLFLFRSVLIPGHRSTSIHLSSTSQLSITRHDPSQFNSELAELTKLTILPRG